MTSLTSDIDRWIHGHDSWSPATRNRYKTTISRAYSLAMKSHKVRTNPARLVDHQHENNERVRWLTPAEEKRLKAAVARRCVDQLPALVTALHTGMRKSEQFRLTWDMVDLPRRTITLVNTKARSRTRHIRIAEHVQWMVREHLCIALIREHESLHEELTTRPIRGVNWTVDSAIVYQAEGRQKTLPLLIHELQKRLSVPSTTLSKKLSVMQKEGHQNTLFGTDVKERAG